MNFETVVKDVKGRLEVVGTRAQGAAEASLETLKQAKTVVRGGVQGLVKTHSQAGKALLQASKTSLEKAKSAGLMAVAQNPVKFLPAGKDTITDAFDQTVRIASRTGEKLAKVFKTGYETVSKKVQGKGAARKPAAAKRRAVRKVAKKANGAATAQAAAA